jgi:hypothetical protein
LLFHFFRHQRSGGVVQAFRSSKWHSGQAASPPEPMQWVSGFVAGCNLRCCSRVPKKSSPGARSAFRSPLVLVRSTKTRQVYNLAMYRLDHPGSCRDRGSSYLRIAVSRRRQTYHAAARKRSGLGLAMRQWLHFALRAPEAGPRRKVFLAARSPRRRAAFPGSLVISPAMSRVPVQRSKCRPYINH